MMMAAYAVAGALIAVALALAVLRAKDRAHSPRRPPPPFPWRGTWLERPFEWSAAGWRLITWGAAGSAVATGFIAAMWPAEANILRLIGGAALTGGVLAGLAEGYFWLLRSDAAKRPGATVGLACVWLLAPPLVFAGACFALWRDLPAPAPPTGGPAYHVTEVTRTGPFTETREYDEAPFRSEGLVIGLALVYAAILGAAGLGLAAVPLAHAAGLARPAAGARPAGSAR